MPFFRVLVEHFVEAEDADEAMEKMENRFENEEVDVMSATQDNMDEEIDTDTAVKAAIDNLEIVVDDETRCPKCDSAQVTEFIPDDRDDLGYQCSECQHIWYSNSPRSN